MIRFQLLAATALLSLAACKGATGNNAATANNAAGNATANAAAPAANNVQAADHGHHQDGPRVLLTANGVLADGSDGSEVRFASPQAQTLAAVVPVLGQPRAINDIEDCGGSGPAKAADFGALVLFFQGETFVGWEQRSASENPYVGTPGGVSAGSTRTDLAAALGGDPSIERTSLGTEFDREGIYGLLDSDRPDARVERIWGGTNCAMR